MRHDREFAVLAFLTPALVLVGLTSGYYLIGVYGAHLLVIVPATVAVTLGVVSLVIAARSSFSGDTAK